MRIERWRSTGLRNLLPFELEPATRANWIVGDNAAGKTAVLEGLYLIARGRSFRGRKHGPIVQYGAEGCRVDAWIRHPERGVLHGWWRATASPRAARSVSALTGAAEDGGRDHETAGLLVRLISAAAPELITGDPALRRQFIDWQVLALDADFGAILTRFRRVQAQRNAWLRAGALGPAIWDEEYAQTAEAIAARRAAYFARLAARFVAYTEHTGLLAGVRPYWHSEVAERPILHALRALRATDQARGFTGAGPNRADFSLHCQQAPWRGSRGEIKIAALLLQLAADHLHYEATGERAVWLVDDLNAELGAAFYQRAQAAVLGDAERQVFFTSLRAPDSEAAVFHVKQGRLIAPSL